MPSIVKEDLKMLYKSLTSKDIIHGTPSLDSLNTLGFVNWGYPIKVLEATKKSTVTAESLLSMSEQEELA